MSDRDLSPKALREIVENVIRAAHASESSGDATALALMAGIACGMLEAIAERDERNPADEDLLLDCWFQFVADGNADGTTGHSFMSTEERLERRLCSAGCPTSRHAPPCRLHDPTKER